MGFSAGADRCVLHVCKLEAGTAIVDANLCLTERVFFRGGGLVELNRKRLGYLF